jgi:hypothetical protein
MLCFSLLAIISIEPEKDFRKSDRSGNKTRFNRFFPNRLNWRSGITDSLAFACQQPLNTAAFKNS